MAADFDRDAICEAVDRLVADLMPGMTTSWSMVLERADEDLDPAIEFLCNPGQLLHDNIKHARMLTLKTEHDFHQWWGD